MGVEVMMTTFEYFYGVNLSKLILLHLDNLSAALQSPNMTAVEGQSLMERVVMTLKSLRTDDQFNLFYAKVCPNLQASCAALSHFQFFFSILFSLARFVLRPNSSTSTNQSCLESEREPRGTQREPARVTHSNARRINTESNILKRWILPLKQ